MAAQKNSLNSAWSVSSGYILFNLQTCALINDRGQVCYDLGNPMWVTPEEDRFISSGFAPTRMQAARQLMLGRLTEIEKAADSALA